MYNLTNVAGQWVAELDWGDDFPLKFEIEIDGIPASLDGDVIVLGIKQNNDVLVEIIGEVSGNTVIFNITYAALVAAGLLPDKSYKFDFWNKTTRFTYIEEGRFSTDGVSHNVEV